MDITLSGKKVEIYEMELQLYKRIERDYNRISNDLIEYMGFSEDYLRNDKWLKRYKKEDLVVKIHQQRDVIRKLISELEPSKKDEYIAHLEQLEKQDEI
ncbi:hypothetical protein MKZ17_07925 [Solibacillus sp. FSL R7-0682]|uniref:hypothetical protein n=1 Tax=Solibacillus sp. FSL R7-0682 TaxID=2921690 RepID=UPI0030F616BF